MSYNWSIYTRIYAYIYYAHVYIYESNTSPISRNDILWMVNRFEDLCNFRCEFRHKGRKGDIQSAKRLSSEPQV